VDGCLAVALDLRFHPLQVCPDAGALIVHVTLALSVAWQRRLLKLLTAEALQGITVPLLPAEQLTNTRVATAFCGGELGHYGSLPTAFWYGRPINVILQRALQLAAWTHFASDCDSRCACGHGLIPLSHRLRRRASGDSGVSTGRAASCNLTLALASWPAGSIADPEAMIYSGSAQGVECVRNRSDSCLSGSASRFRRHAES
jgi:hypothetical protein